MTHASDFLMAMFYSMILLSGCDSIATVTPKLVADCERLCETRGGWKHIKFSAGCYCTDGMRYVIDEPRP